MADIDHEIESIVTRHAQELSQEITGLILRKLGFSDTLPSWASPARAKASAAPANKPSRRAPVAAKPAASKPAKASTSSAAKPSKPSVSKPSKPAKAPSAKGSKAGGRMRLGAGDRAAAAVAVDQFVAASNGVAVSEVEKATKLSRSVVGGVLKQHMSEGKLFMGGNRRFARYASTQAQADLASETARKNPGATA
jgi:hypothetical protein